MIMQSDLDTSINLTSVCISTSHSSRELTLHFFFTGKFQMHRKSDGLFNGILAVVRALAVGKVLLLVQVD